MKSRPTFFSLVIITFMMLFMTMSTVLKAQTYDVFIWTQENNLPLGGVSVELDGETIVTIDGPMGGEAIFIGKAPGTYAYTASKDGYITVNGSVTVVDQNVSDFAAMVPVPLYDVFIWTTENNMPLGGVSVELDGETIVTIDGPMGGEAIFIGKAPGTYAYTASKDGYITVNGSVTVVDQNVSDFAAMVPVPLYDVFIWTTENMMPLGGVTVELDGEIIVTIDGPMGGEAIFIGKAPGTYAYTASKDGYITVNGSVTVVDQNVSDFAAMVPVPVYDVFIWTTENNLALGGVTVVLDGETIVTLDGPMGGEAIFIGKAPGTYTYTASKDGYITFNGSVTVVDQNVFDFAVMVPVPVYDIFIWTTEGGLPLGGVTVELDGEIIVTLDGPMGGEAVFIGKLPGTYAYTASKPGYITVNGSVTVVDQNVSDFAEMIPELFDVFFWVSEVGNPMGLSGVDVTMDGVTVTTGFDGLALFEGYPAGTYNYTSNKDGYITQTGTVTVVDQNIQEFVVMELAVYDMSFWISEFGSPAGLSGVDITIDGVTITSDVDGLALFVDYDPGTYNYTASKSDYFTQTGTVTIVDADIEEYVVMNLAIYDMLIWCLDNGSALTGADVTIDGVTITTGTNGLALFEDYLVGDYNYTAEKEGYATQTGMITLLNQNVNEYVEMGYGLYDMFFWITEEGSPMGLSGADVTIDGVTVTSGFDGLALFEGYGPGDYDYVVSKDGYNTENGSVTIVDENIQEFVEMSLELYDMFFWITEEGNPMGLSGADVTIDGVTVTSDFDGLALFEGYAPGYYDYVVSKDGYITENGSVTIVDENIQEFVEMSQLMFAINFIVDNGLEPIEGAEISVDGITVITDLNGEATFSEMSAGIYVYNVSMDEYTVAEGSVEVIDEDVTVSITLILNDIFNNIFDDVNIYPNPTNGYANIDNAENSTIRIIDQNGSLIMNDVIYDEHTKIDLSANPSGLYNVILISGKNVSSYKLIKVK